MATYHWDRKIKSADEVKILLHRGCELIYDFILKKWLIHESGICSNTGRIFLVYRKVIDQLRRETDDHEPEIVFSRYRMGKSRQYVLSPEVQQEMIAGLGPKQQASHGG